jgi:hypothetical protein
MRPDIPRPRGPVCHLDAVQAPRRSALGIVAVGLVAAGCGRSEHVHVPSADSPCRYIRVIGGDPGIAAGFDYERTHHAFGSPATLTVCPPKGTGDVRPSAESPAVSVGRAVLTASRPVFTFTVTVSPGASGTVGVDLLNQSGDRFGGFDGPTIVTDKTGWEFGR